VFGDPSGTASLITKLCFGSEFDQPIDDFRTGIQILEFGDDFNQPIDYLPHTIEELILGYDFDQPMTTSPNPSNCYTYKEISTSLNCLQDLKYTIPSSTTVKMGSIKPPLP
jgi:FNIP Repeat